MLLTLKPLASPTVISTFPWGGGGGGVPEKVIILYNVKAFIHERVFYLCKGRSVRRYI